MMCQCGHQRHHLRLGLPKPVGFVLLRYVHASSPYIEWTMAHHLSNILLRCHEIKMAGQLLWPGEFFLPLASKIPRVSPVKDPVVSVARFCRYQPGPVRGHSSPSIQYTIALLDHKTHLSNAMTVSQDVFSARGERPFGHAAGLHESHRSCLCCSVFSGVHDSGRPCTTPWSHRPLRRDCRSCISCPDLQQEL